MNCCLKRAVNVFLLDIQRTSSAPPTATWLSMVGASTRRRCDVRKQPGLSTRLPVHRVKNVPGLYHERRLLSVRSMKRGTRSVGGKRRGSSEAEQLPLWKPRGGKRKGAGRKPKGKRAGSAHKTRPELAVRYPVHVVLRVVPEVRGLRRRCTYQAIREATLTTARREDFRIVHLSIQRTHLHLIVEADHK